MEDDNPLIGNVTISKNSDGILTIMENAGLKTSLEKRRMIIPFLVNSHTHLELSFFYNKIKSDIDFVTWLKILLDLRTNTPIEKITAAMRESLNKSWDYGTGMLIDICNDISNWNYKSFVNDLQNVFIFNELIGFDPQKSDDILEAGIENVSTLQETSAYSVGITAHSLYSCSAQLLDSINARSAYPISIHLAEHDAEISMFKDLSGAMVDYMKSIGAWLNNWNPANQSIIKYAIENGLIRKGDLAVHLVKADKEEINLLAEYGIIPCLCPRSNDYFNNGQPAVREMLKAGMKPLLGTDSLASNNSLNMVDEIRFALNTWMDVSPLDIMKMATVNITQFEPFKNVNNFFPLISGKKMPFVELIFENEIFDPYESLKRDHILEQNIYV